MFEQFRSNYASRRTGSTEGRIWQQETLSGASGYNEFMAEFAGATFAHGLYRIHDEDSGRRSIKLVLEMFPQYKGRASGFAYDWLGRQFALDAGRLVAGEPQVLLLEPGTGEALEIPTGFIEFHNEELVSYADAALAAEFFAEWEAGRNVDLGRNSCVGYSVPLFLGGSDTIDNLEVVDLEVYWSLCAQLRDGTLTMPLGTSIGRLLKN